MDVSLLFLISSLVTLCGRGFSKVSSNIVSGTSRAKYTLYITANGIVACLFFLFSGGFKLAFNGATLLYSVAYAAIVAISLISNTVIYKLASISDVNIIVSSAGLIGSAIIGKIVFGETVDLSRIIKICIMLAAAVLIFYENKRKRKDTEKKAEGKSFLRIVVISAVVFVALANTLIIKSFSVSENVTDTNSFFFLTNVILIVGSSVIFAEESVRRRDDFKDAMTLMKPKKLFSLAGNTVFSNIGTLLSVLIMAELPLSLYSPISSALGVLISLAASLIFKEKLGIFSYLAAALAVVAVII